MFLNPALSAALDRISERADDVRRAFTPGSVRSIRRRCNGAGRLRLHARPARGQRSRRPLFRHAQPTRRGWLHPRWIVYRFAMAGCSTAKESRSAALRLRGATFRICKSTRLTKRSDERTIPRIERDGSFVYGRVTVDPRSGSRKTQRVVAGRIALARFPAGTRLATADGSRMHSSARGAGSTGNPRRRKLSGPAADAARAKPHRPRRKSRPAQRCLHCVRRASGGRAGQSASRQDGDGPCEMSKRISKAGIRPAVGSAAQRRVRGR